MTKHYLVYKLTSPSGKVYVGFTGNSLDTRLKVHQYNRQTYIANERSLPRFYAAWAKYPITEWERKIVADQLLEEDAKALEQALIARYNATDPQYGYNMAPGGNGDNTGRNHEKTKREQHSQHMKLRHQQHPELARTSSKRGWVNSKARGTYAKRCKQIQERTPTGREHWKHTGIWVVNHNHYETILEAAAAEGINPWTVNEYCNHPDTKFKRKGRFGTKGQTRREAGFYRIPGSSND